MSYRKRITLGIALVWVLMATGFQGIGLAQQIQTPCELSDFTTYTSYEEMMDYMQKIQAASTEMLLSTYGTTVEGRKIPMTADAENLCFVRDITVIPDFVANAGGLISSYVEHIGGNENQMFEMVENIVSRNTKAVLDKSKADLCSPRECARILARAELRKKSR